MIIHEIIRVERDTVFVFIFEEQVVINLFCPIPLKEPVLVVALPSDVEVGVVVDDVVAG